MRNMRLFTVQKLFNGNTFLSNWKLSIGISSELGFFLLEIELSSFRLHCAKCVVLTVEIWGWQGLACRKSGLKWSSKLWNVAHLKAGVINHR